MASGIPEAAICVQDIDVQCVLQFTLLHAAGCALHRHTSRVIHRLELYRVHLSQTGRCRRRRRRSRLFAYGKSTVVCVEIEKQARGATFHRRGGRFFEPSQSRGRHRPTGRWQRSAKDNAAAAKARDDLCRPSAAHPDRQETTERARYPATLQPSTGVQRRRRGSHTRSIVHWRCPYVSCVLVCFAAAREQDTVMILPQVHLRKPCYDFYFL